MRTSTQFLCVPALETIIDRKFIIVSPETTVVDVLTLVNIHNVNQASESIAAEEFVLGNSHQLGQFTTSTTTKQKTQLLQTKSLQNHKPVNYVLVISQTQLMGISNIKELQTLADLVKNLANIKMAEVVHLNHTTLQLSPEQDLWMALSLLKQHQLSYLPVIDSQSQPIGIISYQTICEALEPSNGQIEENFLLTHQQEKTTNSKLSHPCSSLVNQGESLVSSYSLKLLGLLNPIVEGMAEKLGIEQVMQRIANQLPVTLQIGSCVILLSNGEQKYLSENNFNQDSLLDFSYQVDQHYYQSLAQGQPIILPTINGNCPISIRQSAQNYQICASLVIPLVYQESYLGSIYLHHHSVREWSINEITLITIIAAHCTMAIHEARYPLVVEDQTELICRFAPNYHLTFVNQAYCRYFSQEHSQLLGNSFLPLLPLEEQIKIINCLGSLTHQEPTGEVENLIVTPQGEVRWQHWTHRAIFDEQHNLIEFQAVGQDITERVRAQQALEEANDTLEAIVNERTAALNESNKYLRSEIVKRFSLTRQLKDSQHKLRDTRILQQAILDSASYSIMATSPTGIILTFNRAAEKLLGYKAQELIGRTTPIIFHDSEEINQRLQQLERENSRDLPGGFDVVVAKARQGELEEREWTYIRQDGRRFPVLLSITPLYNNADKLSGFLVIGRDITASKQAQENLRLRERAMAASNNGIVIAVATEPDLPVIYANKAFEKITGYSPAEIMGCNCRLLQGDDHDQPELNLLRQALREHRSCTVVLRNYRKDGTPFWNELSVSPIYDGQGNLTHYIGIQNDITARRSAVEELEKAKAQLQAVLDAVPGMVSWVDDKCHYLGVNQHLADNYNRPPEEFVNQPVNFLNGSIEFDDLMRRFFATNAQKVNREIKAVVGGQLRSYLVAAQKYQQGNAAVSVGFDITALKQTEEELRTATSRLSALIENLQAGVVVEDELGRIVLINQAFCEIFNIPVVPGALIGADFANFAQEYQHCCTQPQKFVRRYQEIVLAREVVTDEEIQFVDGRTFERDYVPIIVANSYCGHLWMYSDITERKRSEAELRQALVKEKELSELKSRFVTNTSHEFRTPLTTILSSSELLEHYRHQWPEEKQLTHIHRIQKSVKHMTQLLNDILIIGKAEAGRLEFKPALINLELFCHELAEELQLNGKNQHEISLNYQGNLSQVLLDAKLLRHILTNLLSNAMKYSPHGSTIELFYACQDCQAIFRVQDQGIGIPAEDQTRLFESFHRATNVGNIQGTGLGLSIVNKCVQVHGGEIAVHSQVGNGTTFTVKLPLK